jgi:uncharacterized LabA/DUF88 family protein
MRYVVMLDGGVVLRRLKTQLQRSATAEDVVRYCKRLRSCEELRGHDLLRILFYDAPPFRGQVLNMRTGKTGSWARTPFGVEREAVHMKLELARDFAFRMGELSFEGYTADPKAAEALAKTGQPMSAVDLRPKITQKGVDLRIGLDIARFVLRERVDTVVVVTGDSDFVPAFKFARREGARVYVDAMGGTVKRTFLVHADVVLDLTAKASGSSG